MGVISGLVRGSGAVETLGRAVQGVSEVFIPNATEGQRLGHASQQAALDQLGDEFALAPRGLFDRFVDGLNRLPRPMLALGTLGLFIYAMVDPLGFGARMEGLAYVPDPLWWLLGAIVGFYFGARELHYSRGPQRQTPRPEPVHSAWHAEDEAPSEAAQPESVGPNRALQDWNGAIY
ncbi:holin family protein [Jannaschia pohangensis]|uniref:Holin of 3TMs, for gene-transfer release n=1 Tax=Jannaschia pohangensis TaxID=390807 RepID=A0A1I3HU17_9RHOB|nr:holin family protein [Jannaschia pohangensis]SFI39225.1 Holin of 3TMs, for gene-transfer release [Jannaschia pohangensis]